VDSGLSNTDPAFFGFEMSRDVMYWKFSIEPFGCHRGRHSRMKEPCVIDKMPTQADGTTDGHLWLEHLFDL
jgi:hypothetical protein